jgi:hypothetical protein
MTFVFFFVFFMVKTDYHLIISFERQFKPKPM